MENIFTHIYENNRWGTNSNPIKLYNYHSKEVSVIEINLAF
jgi:hypothetical protein